MGGEEDAVNLGRRQQIVGLFSALIAGTQVTLWPALGVMSIKEDWNPATAEHTPNSALYDPDAPMGPKVEQLLAALRGGSKPGAEHRNALLIARSKGYVKGDQITPEGLAAIEARIAELHK